MAAQVEVPHEDLTQTRAFPGFEQDKSVPGVTRIISIHSGKSVPSGAFVAVNYRNNWFWIDDRDLEPKQVFSFIVLLFTMVDTTQKENQPLVTIPAH